MVFPSKIAGVRWLMIFWVVYSAVWISLEGALWRVIVMGGSTMLLLIAQGWQRFLAGRRLRRGWVVAATAVSGLALGGGSGLLVLVFMAVKTGLHAHGPEFSAAEVAWMIGQLPLWTAVGLLVGLGLGLIWIGLQNANDDQK